MIGKYQGKYVQERKLTRFSHVRLSICLVELLLKRFFTNLFAFVSVTGIWPRMKWLSFIFGGWKGRYIRKLNFLYLSRAGIMEKMVKLRLFRVYLGSFKRQSWVKIHNYGNFFLVFTYFSERNPESSFLIFQKIPNPEPPDPRMPGRRKVVSLLTQGMLNSVEY